MSRKIETNIQASKFPSYIDENRSVMSIIRDVTILFRKLCKYAIVYGADIETNRECGSLKVVYWKNAEYTNIEITIYHGSIYNHEGDDLTVEFNRLSGSRTLFHEMYSYFIKSGNRDCIFRWGIPRSSLIREEQTLDFQNSVSDNYLDTIFDMTESDYLDIRISGGNLLLKVFKSVNDSDKHLILKHPKISKFLESMMTVLDEGVPNMVCATIAVTFATEAKIDSSRLIQTDIINKQNGIMWKEAQRQLEKLSLKIMC